MAYSTTCDAAWATTPETMASSRAKPSCMKLTVHAASKVPKLAIVGMGSAAASSALSTPMKTRKNPRSVVESMRGPRMASTRKK